MAKWPSIVDDFLSTLQKCRKSRNSACAKLMNIHIHNHGLEVHRVLGNCLVTVLVECGNVSDAERAFCRMVSRSESAWTSLIQGYVGCGQFQHALTLFERMQENHVHPSRYVLQALLKACARLKCIEKGLEIHTEVAKVGLESHPSISTTLVSFYAKHGLLTEARLVFDQPGAQNLVSWNALIAGLAERGLGEEALTCFEEMELQGEIPNAVTFVCILKACGSIRTIDRGQEIHTDIAKEGYEENLFVSNTLVDMYGRCGSLVEAQEVFDELTDRNVVSWNALIAGYVENGAGEKALICLEEMLKEGVSPSVVTFLCTLKACCSMGSIDRGRAIHSEIAKQGFERDPVVGNTLMDMYAKCGLVEEAHDIFHVLPSGNVVLWNALIAGYAEHGHGEEALHCLEQMQLNSVFPDSVTYISILKLCGGIGAIDKGWQIHAEIAKEGFNSDPLVGSTLVDMYGKCGSLAEAQDAFDELPVQNEVSWTALIAAYACQGESELAFQMFERMCNDGMRPNGITFLNVLSVCSREGLVDKGVMGFDAIRKVTGFSLTIEHHNCMVDLLSRAGQLNEALALLEGMPLQPDLVTWNILLGACQRGDNVGLGRQAFEFAAGLDEQQAAAFIMMSKIYVDAHMWEEAKKIDVMRVNL